MDMRNLLTGRLNAEALQTERPAAPACTLCTLHCVVHCVLYTVHCASTLCNTMHCTMCTSLHSALCMACVHCALCIVYCLCTVYKNEGRMHCALWIVD